MKKQLFFLLTFFFGSLQLTFAQYGVLDNSFGNQGRTKIDFGNIGFSICNAMVVDENGFIIIVGKTADGGFSVAKLSSSGQLVNSFGNNGYINVPLSDYDAVATSVALDAAGNIIVAGYVYKATDTDAAIIMLDTNGNLISSFGIGGKLVVSFNSGDDRANAVTLDAYGNIYLGGFTTIGVIKSFAIAKLTATGDLVTSFGTAGKAFYSILTGDNVIYDLLIDADTLYACGYTTALTTFAEDFAVIKTTLSGSLIPNFGSSGKLSISLGVKEERAYTMAKDPFNNFVLAGYSFAGGTYNDFAAAKFDWKGSLVSPFGVRSVDMSSGSMENDEAHGISIDALGNVTLAGFCNWSYNRMAVLRLDKDGNATLAFGSSGKKTQDVDIRHDYGYALAVDASGNFLVGGSANNDSYDQFAVISLNATGNLLPAFGTGGISKFSLAKSYDLIGKIALDVSGNIVLCGTTYKNQKYNLALSKLDASGNVLSSFGNSGRVSILQLGPSEDWQSGKVMSLDQSGNIYAGGLILDEANSRYTPCVIKFDGNGNTVTSFGTAGRSIVTPAINVGTLTDLVIDNAGYMYLVGTTNNGSNNDFVVLKLDPSGALVTNFGNGGELIIPVGTNNDYPKSAMLDGLGNMYITGESLVGSTHQFAVVKITTSGTLVSSFGNVGKLLMAVGTGSAYGTGTVQDGSGNLLIGGYYFYNTSYDFAIVKVDNNGNLITSFGTNGKFTTPVGNRLDQAYSIGIDASGNILLSGVLFETYGSLWGIISVDQMSGTLNTNFGNGGKVVLPYGYCYTQAITSAGDVIIAGTDSHDFSVAKLTGIPAVPTENEEMQSEQNPVMIYPNPSSGALCITTASPLQKVVLTDTYGRTEEYANNYIISKMKGIILVTVYTSQGKETKKIILE